VIATILSGEQIATKILATKAYPLRWVHKNKRNSIKIREKQQRRGIKQSAMAKSRHMLYGQTTSVWMNALWVHKHDSLEK
jgi:hypothetical protein